MLEALVEVSHRGRRTVFQYIKMLSVRVMFRKSNQNLQLYNIALHKAML